MDQMHPHWQTTDDEVEVPVRIAQKAGFAPKAADVPQAKRSPAALFGILMILLTGFFSFGGMDLFSAQVALEPVVVTLDENGVTPQEITVHAGQRITWMNTGTIPHILSSDTLMDDKGKPFETTAIFPGSELSFDVPSSTQAGTFEYVSKTSPSVTGTIIVESQITTMAPVSSASSISAQSAVSVAAVVSSASSIPSSVSVSSAGMSDGSEVVDQNGIPVNPYTVANTYTGPTTKGTTAAVTTHRPVTNTEAGAGLWLAVASGIAAMVLVLRKASLKI
jgi:plastocyanin